jgi:hypothetical protein
MTQDEAIDAIKAASKIFVCVPVCISYDGSTSHIEKFAIRKEDAIEVLKNACDSVFEPNIEINEGGDVVTIGKGWLAPFIEDLSDDESSEGDPQSCKDQVQK